MNAEFLSLEVSARTADGKGEARRVRAQGLVPAVVYGKGTEGTAVSVEPKKLKAVLSTAFGFNNVFSLSVDDQGNARNCMVKAYQIDPVRRELTHVDFYQVDPEQIITIEVPIEAVGTSVGVKAGGRLQIVTRAVRLRCAVKNIPSAVLHDVTPVQVGDAVYIDEITPPAGCEFVYRNRFPVIRIARKRGAKAAAE